MTEPRDPMNGDNFDDLRDPMGGRPDDDLFAMHDVPLRSDSPAVPPAEPPRPDAAPSGPVKTRRTNVGGRPFSSRNPTTIGAIGLVLIVVMLWASFNAAKLPIIGGGTTYSAYFTEAAGLLPGDPVRIAGVKVGSVDKVGLDTKTGQVLVKFKVKHAFVGDQSVVSIKLKTILGAKYLGIDSIGQNKQNPHQAIPHIAPDGSVRTNSPFDVYPAFTELTKTVDAIDTDKLAQSFGVLAEDFSGTPSTVKTVLSGLTRLSNTIASRDAALRTLLQQANNVTTVLADRDAELQRLFSDGGALLDELNARRDVIHQLLLNTTALAVQLEGVVQDNTKTIGPMLAELKGVLDQVQRNQDGLDRSIQLFAPFYRVFNNTIGNGRWFDNYICNLGPAGITGILGFGSSDAGCQ